MATITGTTGNDTLIIQSDTTSVQAGAGTDIVIFSGNYADYTFSQSDSFVPLMTHNTTAQVVSLYGVEKLQFDDVQARLSTPTGNELQVINTDNNGIGSIAALNDGGYIVAWSGNNDAGSNAYLQRYDDNGNVSGSVVTANSNTLNNYSPRVTSLKDGGYIVTWIHRVGSYGTDEFVYLQRYDNSGNTVGDETKVNTTTLQGDVYPNLSALNDDGYVVTWGIRSGQDGEGSYLQRYDVNGDTVGNEVKVNTNASFYIWNSVTALNDGGYVVAWANSLQRFDVSGNKAGNEVVVNTALNEIFVASVQSLDDGGFVVLLTGKNGTDFGVYLQRYDVNGNTVGNEVKVNTTDIDSDNDTLPFITMLNDTDFVVTWQGLIGSDYDIYLQRYDSSVSTVGVEVVLNTTTAHHESYPDISALNDGGYVLTWSGENNPENDPHNYDIYLQRFDGEDNPLGLVDFSLITTLEGTDGDDIINVNSYTTSVQAGAGTDTVVFSGNYADYTFSQSDSYVPLMTHNTTGQVVSLYGVEKLVFDDGTVAITTTGNGEFLVNTYTSGSQFQPSTTALSDGGFVITWMSDGQDGGGYGIYAQRYDANGLVNRGEFQVNTYTSSDQYAPSTTALNDGGFVITWMSLGQDGDSAGIYAQRYDANGSANGNEFLVNTYTSSSQYNPSTTALNDGGFVITWESGWQDGSYSGIYAQRYDANGSANGGEFLVNTYTTSWQSEPSTTALNDGGFVITWYSIDQDGSGYGIYAQRYDANGLVNGSEFLVNTVTSSDHSQPRTTALNDGGFVITWTSYGQDGDQHGIYAQRYDANGSANGNEFLVNTVTSSNQFAPSTSALSDGGFVITWQSYHQDGDGYGIYAQRYDANGSANGNEFLVNTVTSSDQSQPSTTALNDGGFVITWESGWQDGSYSGIYAQRYDADGNPLGEIVLNALPALSLAISDASTNEDAAYSYDASANFSDVDVGDTLTYSATLQGGGALPAWLSINSSTGILSGTPENEDVRTIDVTVTATDTNSASISDTYMLTVNNTNDAPTLSTAISDTSTNEDAAYSYDASANFSDVDVGDTFTYSAALADDAALPSWLSINSSTGILSGTPANGDVGDIAVKVTATDGDSASVSDTYTLTVNNTNDAAIISGSTTGAVTEDSETTTVTGTLTHTDVDVDNSDNVFTAVTDVTSTYGSYSVTTAGVWTYTLDNTNSAIDALAAATTTDTITVMAEDGTTKDVMITITGTNDAPVITSSATVSAPENGTAVMTVTATDVDSGSVSYSISGTDAALFSIDASSGVLTFNTAPDYELIDPFAVDNTYSLIVSASDGVNATNQNVTITVTNINDAPTLSTAITDTSTNEDAAYSYDASANFSDVDLGDTFTYSAAL